MKKLLNIINLYKRPGARAVGIYTFTNFFGKAASFLLLFVFTNPLYITPSENGLLNLMSTSILFLMPFVSMGTLHSISVDFFKLSPKEFRNHFTSGLVMPVIIVVLAYFLMYLLKGQLNTIYGIPASFVWIVPTIVFFSYINEHLWNLLRNNNEPERFFKVTITQIILELGLSALLVVVFAWRWHGRVAGILVAFGITTLYAFYYFKKKGYIFGNVKWGLLKNELYYAGPIVLMQGSIFCLGASDKFFLSGYTNDQNATLGIYSIAAIFASVINIMGKSTLYHFFPKIFSQLSTNDKDLRLVKRSFLQFIAIMIFFLLALIFLSPLAYHLFINEKYYSALNLIPLLSLGSFFWTVNYFFYASMLYYKQKRKILIISVFTIVISLLINNFFIKNWESKGAAYGVCLSYFLVLLFSLWINRSFVKKVFSKPVSS